MQHENTRLSLREYGTSRTLSQATLRGSTILQESHKGEHFLRIQWHEMSPGQWQRLPQKMALGLDKMVLMMSHASCYENVHCFAFSFLLQPQFTNVFVIAFN